VTFRHFPVTHLGLCNDARMRHSSHMNKRVKAGIAVAATVAFFSPVTSAVADQAQTASAPPAAGGVRVVASLSGSNVVPGPGDRDGKGRVSLDLHPKLGTVCVGTIEWQNLGIGNITAAHVHRGRAGDTGKIAVNFTRLFNGGSGCRDVGRQVVRRINHHPRAFYFDLHTKRYPAGAIRGQLHHVA
jgi:CHRD domain